MGKFQNVNFVKAAILKVTNDYSEKKIVLRLFKIPLAHRPRRLKIYSRGNILD
jgi:hypothetical protein